MKAVLVGLVLLSMIPPPSPQGAKHWNYRVCNLIMQKCMVA
jgi:hypothetical protein